MQHWGFFLVTHACCYKKLQQRLIALPLPVLTLSERMNNGFSVKLFCAVACVHFDICNTGILLV